MSQTETSNAAEGAQTAHARCDQCSSPVDEGQRYCVVCGSRNKRAEDPVSRYLTVATSRLRATKASRPAAARRRRGSGLGTAAVIAAIPLAVALGVLVGRANSGGDAKLIAALRAEKPPVVTVTGGGAAASATPAGLATSYLASTFSLAQGYSVELRTLPVAGTGQAAVGKAERAAQAAGATAVGLLDLKRFIVSPKPGGDVYVLYSGQFKTKAAANAALTKLKRRFPSAVVIAVRTVAGSSSSSTGAGQIKVAATKAQLAQGAQEVRQISHATGSSYVQAQNNLPGQIAIP